MTGFGKGELTGEGFSVIVYAKSLNHRYLEINIKMPKRYQLLEERVRKLVAEYIVRGRVEIWVKFMGISPVSKEVIIDIAFAKKLKENIEKMKEVLGFEEPFSFSDFVRFRDYIYLEEPEEDLDSLWKELEPALIKALQELKNSRIREGALLEKQMFSYFEELEKLVKKVSEIKEEVKQNHINKFKERIDMLKKEFETELDEKRLYQEVVLFLDRFDFSEEIDRLNAHLVHFKETAKEKVCGKKLDFICQEMFREVNTLTNKAQDITVSKYAVKMKDLIEKIREQVQNVT